MSTTHIHANNSLVLFICWILPFYIVVVDGFGFVLLWCFSHFVKVKVVQYRGLMLVVFKDSKDLCSDIQWDFLAISWIGYWLAFIEPYLCYLYDTNTKFYSFFKWRNSLLGKSLMYNQLILNTPFHLWLWFQLGKSFSKSTYDFQKKYNAHSHYCRFHLCYSDEMSTGVHTEQ